MSYRTENESLADEVTCFHATFTEFDGILGNTPIVAQQSAAKQVAKIVEGADVLEDPSKFWKWIDSVNKLDQLQFGSYCHQHYRNK